MTPTRLTGVPLLPEITLYQADEQARLFDDGYSSERPPPFWAFAWPGGVALARHVLDRPETVRGRRVVDLGSGSGVVAIAASLAQAQVVRAVDADPAAITAIERNAAANGAQVEAIPGEADPVRLADAEVVLVGDAFYTASVAAAMTKLLSAAARRGVEVLVGDPGRGFLPRHLLTEVARYDVPVRPALEDTGVKPTTIWRFQR
ncbi:MAG: methyltransferase [Hamadaea sp.]|uniref:class I SAM-dependent methyltransferase n=1 Tax=Hamadaea sp. TaxID=2024425 RepID=UPI001807581C|nr:50S ribosomal protein L11 methyltransferase [Hamadaea sp.]NUR72581.1 methyltransferase [Hamadaea sp.]NUT22210.1 methyltransferase [Hamadaea sp.]